MRIAVTGAVLLAVVATAVVTVCQHSETRHLQYRVWKLNRRNDRLERSGERLRATVEGARTPRRLLSGEAESCVSSTTTQPQPATHRVPTRGGGAAAIEIPAGFHLGDNFEGGNR